MKLAKALKLKNKIAGEIGRAQQLALSSNVTEGSNAPQHDVTALYTTLCSAQERLAELKGKITVANGPIAQRLFMLAELKGRIAFLRELPTKDGEFPIAGGYGREAASRQFHAVFKAGWVETETAMLSERIEQLQDEIDEFNASTSI